MSVPRGLNAPPPDPFPLMVEHYEHVRRVKAALTERLSHGHRRPGERFLSTRALADRFDVSYQTAHRLLNEMVAEGWLVRRPRSGTYIPGQRRRFRGVELIFHPRCRREGSFGAHLLQLLVDRMRDEGIDYRINRAAEPDGSGVPEDRLPIIWEQSALVRTLAERQHPAIVLNDRPPVGAGSLFIDSLSTDDFGGGVLAGQLLRQHLGKQARLGILAGPREDARSKNRVQGLASTGPAFVAYAKGWYYEQGLATATRLMQRQPDGVFCANDRLAEGLLGWLHQHRVRKARPAVVGFDDAPIAEQLDLTTIAIPWRAMVDFTLGFCRIRFAGQEYTPAHRILNPRPIVRSTITPATNAAPAFRRLHSALRAGASALDQTSYSDADGQSSTSVDKHDAVSKALRVPFSCVDPMIQESVMSTQPFDHTLASYAACIGIDWADREHAMAMQVTGDAKVQQATLPQDPEALEQWATELHRR